jgi:hypothetical protein
LAATVSGVDDLAKHTNDHLSWNNLARSNHIEEFKSNSSLSLIFISDERVDIKVNETLLLESLNDFLTKFI